MISLSLVENLVAEAFGLAATALLFTWIGGSLAKAANERDFSERWANYRRKLSLDVKKLDEDLGDQLLGLRELLKKQCAKDRAALSRSDLERAQEQVTDLRAAFHQLEGFVERHHFALRERDIALAQDLVAAVARIRHSCDRGATLGNYLLTLSAGLENPEVFDRTFPPQFFPGNRYDFMLASGVAAVSELDDAYKQLYRHASSLPLQDSLSH